MFPYKCPQVFPFEVPADTQPTREPKIIRLKTILLIASAFLLGCSVKPSLQGDDHRVFRVKFPSKFPFGRDEYLDSLELKIGGKTISYDHSPTDIRLAKNDQLDTMYFKNLSDQKYAYVFAKFRSGEKYHVVFNECEGEFQLQAEAVRQPNRHNRTTAEFRVQVRNLQPRDTLLVRTMNNPDILLTSDSTRTDWNLWRGITMCANSFLHLSIEKVSGVHKVFNPDDSTSWYLEADTKTLRSLSFQQLHGERLDLEYDYGSDSLQIQILE
ncbi:MAG: hypothetical protein IPN71_18655 [Fibrobacteres bacterium]|nr:hypothetical protein [Fibrobacterota bacterium]